MTFRSPPRIVTRLVPITACLALAACGASTAPLTVEVRDAATHEPAQGITVVADVPSKFHPFSVGSMLGQTGPDASHAKTDAGGRATVQYIPGRPVRLGVLAPGWDEGFLLIDPEAIDFDPDAWHAAPDLPKIQPRQPEYRIEKH